MKLSISILLSFFSLAALAQHSVQGHVIDGETNTPLPGANVFIAKTTYGVSTDSNGAFTIKNLRAVHYQLVVSYVGYGTQVFDVLPSEPKTYKVILKPLAKTLNEVVVTANKKSRSEWLANYKIFKEKFIGLSENSKFCTIENPRVLDFNNENGLLKATADSTLIIVNKGLGYRIKVLLEKYEFNIITYLVHYEGQIVYEQLVPENETEKIRWARNRLKAYYGSEMHFLRTLYTRRLNEEGYFFNVIKEVNLGPDGGGMKRIGVADATLTPRSPIYNDKKIKVLTITNYNRILDSLSLIKTPEQPLLRFKGDLEIQYIMEAETYDYQVNRHIFPAKTMQRSTIILRKPAIVQSHGQTYPQDAIETKGYWSWELIAESLPLDYETDNDQKIASQPHED